MKAVFADTFYLVALSDPADARYLEALAVDDDLAEATIFTTDEVLSEFLTFFAADEWSRARAPGGSGIVPESKKPYHSAKP